MKLRFQADKDLNQCNVVDTNRLDPAVDFQTAAALGLHHLPDYEVLALAAREGRVLVSHDRRTLPRYFRELVASRTSPGLIIVSQWLPVGAGGRAAAPALGGERGRGVHERHLRPAVAARTHVGHAAQR